MNVFISGDIEGITGLVAWSQCGRPNSDHFDFDFARRMYTHDINSAIRGARHAGAGRIVVKDSHGNSKNLLIDQLEPGIELVSGYGSRFEGMMVGLDSSFDAAMLIGYHAMAGTLHGVMEHTISGRVHRMWINGKLTGEIGLSTITAGNFGVPLVAISSDVAGCAEAADLIPQVQSAAVKNGFGRYMSQVKHPSDTGQMIEEAARSGAEMSNSIAPYRIESPHTVRVEFNRSEEADMAVRVPATSRVDAYTIERTSDDWEDLHRSIWCMISMAEAGAQANN
jgi:D-amino peptidase